MDTKLILLPGQGSFSGDGRMFQNIGGLLYEYRWNGVEYVLVHSEASPRHDISQMVG